MSGPAQQPIRERLARHMFIDPDGCWIWIGHRFTNGYGAIGFNRPRRSRLAHRVSYELFRGPIPEGLTLDHLCRVPECINPEHLEPVTMRENILRGTSPSATAAFRSTCLHGHPWTEANTYRAKDGSRSCRTCHRLWARAAYRKVPSLSVKES